MNHTLPYAILLKDKCGFKETGFLTGFKHWAAGIPYTNNKMVLAGSLLQILTDDEITTLAQCIVNYKVLTEGGIKLHCEEAWVHPLTTKQKDYLLAVKNVNDRFEVYQNLKWVEKLQVGSRVFVKVVNVCNPVRATVHYIGNLPGENGIQFGVELLSKEGRGQGTSDGRFKEIEFFKCAKDCAVFVAMDKLTDAGAEFNNPYNLEVGSAVQYMDFNQYGVIKWIGCPLGSKGIYAGVEMENDVMGADRDGEFMGIKYFECKPGKGKFVFLNTLKPDQRNKKLSGDAQPLEQNPYNLKVGSIIEYGKPILYGVIKWIGQLHGEQGLHAGVELDYVIEDPHDGTWAGIEYYKCKPNRGMFVLLSALKPATRDKEKAEKVHQDVEQKICVVEGQMRSYIKRSEETIQRMEDNVDNAFRKALEVQSINKELQVNNAGTQQQLLDMQKNNEHLQSQMLTILDKLSHTQQQLLDMQKSNEQLQKANAHLQDQLSLTQQQLLGVQSMMTCSRLWVVSHDQFTIGREIGRGAWATVHETTFRGAKVAAKRLHDEITSPETIKLFHQEMEMALHCQHQNIVTFLGVTMENHPVILMELMDISLRSAYKRGNVKYQQVLKIFCDIASALHFLHTRSDPLIHRDVSSANVLLKAIYNGEWLAKLGDLGTAKLQQYCTTPGPGALAYAAPEVADPKRHSTKMDVYSFGVLVVEVLTKTLPFQNLNTLKGQVQQQFPQYHQLVISCTNQQSSDRPTMYDVIGQLNKIL